MKFFRNFPSIQGFDTESYKGNILLATTPDEYIENIKGFNEILDFLWYNGKQLNFFFNISFDFGILFKPLLVTKKKQELNEIREFHTLNYGDYEISFIGNKAFHIQIGKRKKDYYDTSQFYNDGTFPTLDTVAKEVLGVGKNNEELEIDRKRIGEEYGYYAKNRARIIKYGMKDAQLTRDLAIKKVESIYKTFGIYPKKWYSNASISKAYLDVKHNDEKWQFWRLIDGNKDAFNYIYETYYGGIFQTFELGNHPKVSEIDINSAYPHAIRRLKSIVGAQIKKVCVAHKDADYGFYRVAVKYNGLIPYRTPTSLIYPVSSEPIITYMTAIEYFYWLNHKDTEIQFLDGYEIYTPGKQNFKDYEDIYIERNRIKKKKGIDNHLYQYNLKLVLNATYGCMAESKAGFTYWSNFVYASYITATTRIMIYKMIEKIGIKNVIAIMTDAIAFKSLSENPGIKESDSLGGVKYEFKDKPGIFYMNGLYVLDSHLKKRGFANLKIEDLKGGDSAKIKRLKIRKVIEAIIQDKIIEIGDFKLEDKDIKLKSNLMKFDYPVDKLTFDNLNVNTLRGFPIYVTGPAIKKPYNEESLDSIIKREKKIRRFVEK